jgi:hypothetical protein
MKRTIRMSVGLAVLAGAHLAGADPKHTLVLKSEGNASADNKSKIDTQVVRLARSLGGNVEAGEISYTDATAAVGCNASESSCKDEVLATLGVDEIVVTNVTNAPGGDLKVTVRLIPKTGMPKEQTTVIPGGQAPDAKLNADIGPMFGAVPPPEKPATVATTTTTVVPPAAPVTPPATDTATTPVTATDASTTNTTPAKPVTTGQIDTVTAAPNGQIAPEGHADHRRLEMTGMAVGGGLVLLSFVMWAEASSTQNDIDAAPAKSAADLRHLQDLESQGDAYAGLGNLMFIGGLGVAAVSTYFWWRDRRADHGQQARLAPTVFDHGAGVTLSFGGGR